MSKISEGKFLP